MRIKANKGFTLIEVMITVAIIGILAAIAIPAYTQYVQRGRVAEATSNLSSLRVALEQYYQDNRTYVGGVSAPAAGDAKYFAYAPTVALSANAYTITATGVAGLMDGYTYTINQNNVKTSTVPGGVGATCWISKAGEAC